MKITHADNSAYGREASLKPEFKDWTPEEWKSRTEAVREFESADTGKLPEHLRDEAAALNSLILRIEQRIGRGERVDPDLNPPLCNLVGDAFDLLRAVTGKAGGNPDAGDENATTARLREAEQLANKYDRMIQAGGLRTLESHSAVVRQRLDAARDNPGCIGLVTEALKDLHERIVHKVELLPHDLATLVLKA